MAAGDPWAVSASVAPGASLIFQPAAGTIALFTTMYQSTAYGVPYLTDGTTDNQFAGTGTYRDIRITVTNSLYLKIYNSYTATYTFAVGGFYLQ
jgi:hypothetical protein